MVLRSGQIRPQTRAECEDAMSLLSRLASSVCLCARERSCVCLTARWVVDVDADARDSVQCLSIVSSAMGRNLFLVVALSFRSCYCDFLTARAANARHKVKAFSILRHPQDPLSFLVTKTSPFFRSPSQVVRIACFEYSFGLPLCVAYVRRPSFFQLASGPHMLYQRLSTCGVCSDTHRPSFHP
jgi:hypothetical protein